jgi:DNA-binding IclR family transcriptional regulator
MDNMENSKYNIKAVTRCLEILDFAASSEQAITLNQVCQTLHINANMAFRILSCLVSSNFMGRDEATGQYTLSLKALNLSHSALMSLNIRKFTMPYMELLWNQYPRADVNMAVYYGGEILVVDRIDSVNIPRTYFTPGKTVPFHCTALGKMLTCELPESELNDLIARTGLKSYTHKTITDPGKLKKELARVRKEQIARDRQEHILNDNCNAAPIRNSGGKIIAAISIAAFENCMTEDEMEKTFPVLQNLVQKISELAASHT